MVQCDDLASISNDDLFTTAQRLTARVNVTLADLLSHLGEIERRGIHRLRACASLYTYCLYELRMSEDAAYRRSKAARLVREYPELYDAIAKGEIHLTGVLMIGPHLGGERHAEILRRARFRSKRELLRLIAELDPKPEVPALVEPIGPAPPGRATHAALVEALSGPIRQLPPGKRPEDWIEATTDDETEDWSAKNSEGAAGELVDAEEHQRALRYRVQFTASQEFVDLLEEASDLIGHETQRVTLPEIQTRALRALVQQLRARKRAATKVSRRRRRRRLLWRSDVHASHRMPRRRELPAYLMPRRRELPAYLMPRRRGAELVTFLHPYAARCSNATAGDARTWTAAVSDVAKLSGSRFTTVTPTPSADRRRSTTSSSGAARTMPSLRKKTLDKSTSSPAGRYE